MTNDDVEICYIIFIGQGDNLFCAKFDLQTGQISIVKISDVEFNTQWNGKGGHSNEKIYVYLNDKKHLFCEVEFDTQNDKSSLSQPFTKKMTCNWWDVVSVSSTKRSIFCKPYKSTEILLANYANDKWKLHSALKPAKLKFGSVCTINNEPHLFINSGVNISHVFHSKKQWEVRSFTNTSRHVKPPIPFISSLSPIRSCVDSRGRTCLYFISNGSVFYEMAWEVKTSTWIFTPIGMCKVPECLFPGKMFPASVYSVTIDYGSLEICVSPNNTVVFCNLVYVIENIVNLAVRVQFTSSQDGWIKQESPWNQFPPVTNVLASNPMIACKSTRIRTTVTTELYNKECHFSKLPQDILLVLLQYLHPIDLIEFSLVSKDYRDFITKHDEFLFKIPSSIASNIHVPQPCFLSDTGSYTVNNDNAEHRTQLIRKINRIKSKNVKPVVISLFGPASNALSDAILPRLQVYDVMYNGTPNPVQTSQDNDDKIETYLYWRRTWMNHVPRGSYDWAEPEPLLTRPHIIMMCYDTERDDTVLVEKTLRSLALVCKFQFVAQPYLLICGIGEKPALEKMVDIAANYKGSHLLLKNMTQQQLVLKLLKISQNKSSSVWQ